MSEEKLFPCTAWRQSPRDPLRIALNTLLLSGADALNPGERCGGLAYEQLQSLPIQWVDQTEEGLLLEASRMKAFHPLSVVDAWIAPAARLSRATLLHKDPEVEAITELDQDWLA